MQLQVIRHNQNKQHNEYRQQPPLFIVFKEKPKLCEQRSSLFPGQLVEFSGFLPLRIFRHLYSPILSELVEIAVEAVGPSPRQPITVRGGIKLAAKRITAYQAKDKSKRRKQQKVKRRQQCEADRPTDG